MHHLQHITDLGLLLAGEGIRRIILPPGSRNAPLIQLFTGRDPFRCHSIVDERSAGYVALGMSGMLNEPVAVVPTSGTAVLNLAPSLAEAFHQQVPLIAITADRPRDPVGQFDNQVVDQRAPFFGFTKGFYEFPTAHCTEQELEQSLLACLKLVREAVKEPQGPVHINIPLVEPLYVPLPDPLFSGKKRDGWILPSGEMLPEVSGQILSEEPPAVAQLAPQSTILILVGMGDYGERMESKVDRLADTGNVAIMAENLANLKSRYVIGNPEVLLGRTPDELVNSLDPDLVVVFGGRIVSKQLRGYVHKLKEADIWVVEGNPEEALDHLLDSEWYRKTGKQGSYLVRWKRLEEKAKKDAAEWMDAAPFCTMNAIRIILETLPSGAVLHLGNSATIRYAQWMPVRTDLTFKGNRGTSGIDGSFSTAVGAAMVSEKEHILVLGDLSFVYDSNALWNKDFPQNLKIVVLNDGGGGIFRVLDGASGMPFLEDFSVTHHPVSLELISESFGKGFLRVDHMDALRKALRSMFRKESVSTVLEVDTSGRENSRIFKSFITNHP